jgi:threonine dehydrogenase-like Zn-dependent dehydrogenase
MYRHEDCLEAASLIAQGKIILDPLVSKHFPFAQFLDAYNYIGDNGDKVMKVMIDL